VSVHRAIFSPKLIYKLAIPGWHPIQQPKPGDWFGLGRLRGVCKGSVYGPEKNTILDCTQLDDWEMQSNPSQEESVFGR
jgi:hypothetical protein